MRPIERNEKAAFWGAFAGGMAAHLYLYTNLLPNFDGISRMYEEQQMTVSGRWFLHYASYLYGFTQNPMLIGILAMFFLGLTAIVTTRLLSVRDVGVAAVWGVLSVLTPAVAYTNSYTFTVVPYCLAVLGAAMAVFLVERKGLPGFFGGCILLAFSMGIYQVYVTTAIILSMYLVLRDALKPENSMGRIILKGIRFAVFLGTGTLLYRLILKLFLWVKQLRLLSYLGMNQLEEGYPLERAGEILTDTYAEVWKYFVYRTEYAYSGYGLRMAAVLVLLAVTVVLLAGICRERKLCAGRIAFLLILILLMPLGVNFGRVMSPFSATSPTMKFSYVYLCLLPVLLAEELRESTGKGILKYCAGSVLPGMLLLGFVFWQQDNTLYTMLNQVHRSTLSFVTNVVSRIESCPGYSMGMPVVIVGGYPSDRYNTDISVYDWVEEGALLSSSVIPLNKHIYYYMNDWLNVPIEEPAQEVFEEVASSELFQQMPRYPDDGSVQIYDGRCIVKMQEMYTPKAQYEIEYEKRR